MRYGRLAQSILLCVAVSVGCGMSAEPQPGSAGIALHVSVPGPLPDPADLIAAGESVTEATRKVVGLRLVADDTDVPGGTVVVGIDAPEVVLTDLPPGDAYTLHVFAGFEAEDGGLGVVQYYGSAPEVNLPPDETVAVSVSLRECTVQSTPEELERCRPDFGFDAAPPAPPVLFPEPPQTRCDDYVAAGTKPEDTIIRLSTDARALVSDTDPYWKLDLSGQLATKSSGSQLTMNLYSADASDTENSSLQFDQLDIKLLNSALCFNPYGDESPPHIERDNASQMTFRWQYSGPSTQLAYILQAPGTFAPKSMTALPAQSPDTYGTPITADIDAGAVQFSVPATSTWELVVYRDDGTGWFLEGAFTYDPDWIANESPALQ